MLINSRAPSLLQDSIGYTGCFYDIENPSDKFSSFSSILKTQVPPLELDSVALCGFASRFAFFGDRTLVKSIKRTSFFSHPNEHDVEKIICLPPHQRKIERPEKIAENLALKLEKETYDRVIDFNHIGILLSGGMDSRVLASVLKKVQKKYSDFKVTCFCWGSEDCRDVVYARKIAEHYQWPFEHFNLSARTLLENIYHSANAGCFYSALHLHAMPEVASRAKLLNVEIMLAGSYGDSIGRAEYSSIHVEKLAPIERKLDNWFGVINQNLFDKSKAEILNDIDIYRKRYGSQTSLAVNELDYQLHYMRNMLGSAMSIIDKEVMLAQAFTSRDVLEYMWGLDPECRKDDVYYHLLSLVDEELLDIPWARTGKPYLNTSAEPDILLKSFHNYGSWVKDISKEIEVKIFSRELEALNFFNMKAVDKLYKAISGKSYVRSGRMLEIVVWLASLAVFVEKNNVNNISSDIQNDRIKLKHRAQYYGSLFNQYRCFRGMKKEKL